VDQDLAPVWSPRGDRIAFVRIPASFDDFDFANQRSGEPWSIRVVDVATGTGREVWRASTGTGSVFRELGSARQFFWAAGDRLVFPWEKDGWTHLYSVAVAGGVPTLLTPGAFEVEHVSLTPDGSAVLYSSNQGDIDRRHIWRVAAAGSAPVPLTSGTGLEWGPVPSGDGRTVAILRSDARGPARPAVLSGQGQPRDLAAEAIPAEFPRSALVEPQQVIFNAADGLQIHGQLFLPPDLKPGEKRPAVVFFHGGSRRQMLLGWHYMYYYHNTYGFNQYLASSGYVVLSANYRSGIGYGMEFREALNYGAGGASEFNDVLGAGLYLRGRSDVDGARIGLWGGSYGGYLTALGLSRASDLFAAGVDLHGVHDWNKVIENFVPVYNPAKDPERARVAYQSSPMASVGTWRSPVLLIHGDDDRNVPFTETVSLAAALRKQGVEFEQLVFPDDVHDFLLHRNWLRAYAAATDFLGRKLGR
jgi:dipeptidyl aminopeptidase/acylaminoacyl peptidase